FFFVMGFGSRVDLEHRFPICRFEIVLGCGVDFEDGEFATALHRVVADTSPRRDREILDRCTLPFQRLVVPPIFSDHSDEVGYAALDEPNPLLLDKLSNQNMKISHLLVRSRKTMIYDKMDSLRVPDLLNTHLTEDLDRQGSRAILGHSHIGRQNRDFARMVN